MTLVLYVLTLGFFVTVNSQLYGFLYLILCVFLILVAWDTMYYSFAYATDFSEPYLFELASILSETSAKDIVGSFARSYLGKIILLRCGVDDLTRMEYLHKRVVVVDESRIDFPPIKNAFESYISGIYNADKNLMHLLVLHGISEDDFLECAKLAIRLERKKEDMSRWWGNKKERNLAETTFIELLEHRAYQFEKESNFVVSYPALTYALPHLIHEEDEDGIVHDILWESAESAHSDGRRIIYREDVDGSGIIFEDETGES